MEEKVLNLDEKDRKIIYELTKNARMSASQIGKKTRLAQHVVQYRIKKLESEGIIKKYVPILNYAKLGYIVALVMIDMQSTTVKKEDEFINFLQKIPSVIKIGKGSGEYDIWVALAVKNLHELDEHVDIMEQYGHLFSKREILFPTLWVLSVTKMLNPKSNTKFNLVEACTPINLENKDFKILKELTNARTTLLEISNKLKISVESIRYRLKNMKEKGVISGFTTVLDLNNIGLKRIRVFLDFQNADHKKYYEIFTYLEQHPAVQGIIKILGPFEIIIDVLIPHKTSIVELLREWRVRFPKIIKDYKFMIVYETIHKVLPEIKT